VLNQAHGVMAHDDDDNDDNTWDFFSLPQLPSFLFNQGYDSTWMIEHEL
jgi:hypothetical protein